MQTVETDTSGARIYKGMDWDYEAIRRLPELEREETERKKLRGEVLADFKAHPGPLIAALLDDMQSAIARACVLDVCGYRQSGSRIFCKRHCTAFGKAKTSDDKISSIVKMYSDGLYTTQQVADQHGTNTKRVQLYARAAGVLRTAAESRLLALKNGHWHYRKLTPEQKKKRTPVSARLRYKIIAAHPYCELCGNKASELIRLEVDHIDKNPGNNNPDNLQVLCDLCNMGKGG